MKKTLRTVLTAAAFAAANMCAMPTAANAVNEQPKEINPVEEVERKFMAVYGPPPSMLTTTSATTSTLITSTTTTPVCVYGPMTTVSVTSDYLEDLTTMTTTTFPPTVYGPPKAFMGDVNMDGVVDIFDAVALRKAILYDEYSDAIDRYWADLNKDGQISVGDLVRLNRYLLGTLKDFDDLPDKN
ncbi:hypothetical protein SAMN02910265_02563 [Ruminococcus flavefaciens]|uniref:Dockerin domain-containing protein n=1 Tax=Ruminococcus flavefaciens TaxID=1265 RepID=A0A1H6KWU9_RUMFL|nr:dockerin type I repeat-containing protein [Ruminococcus flavefaciens]SEH76479.1 hypothetical protein SAMN02910265_02563 [Ruminococcus flavefaciens]